jgi:hypothetical protein
MAIVWYVLIHVSLGLIGYQYFQFNNLGAIYAALATAVVQSYAIWETHKITKPKFDMAYMGTPGSDDHQQQLKEYKIRLLRLFGLRVSAFSILTLVVASLMRGAEA